MRLTFVVPTAQVPSGGALVLYEWANALSRRGHAVHVVHVDFIGDWREPALWIPRPVHDSDELTWFRLDEGITSTFCTGPGGFQPDRLPDGDVIFCYFPGLDPRLGRPVAVVQGYGVIGPEMDDALFLAPCPTICVARWLVDIGRRLGVPERQLVHVPPAIDHERFRLVDPTAPRSTDVALVLSVIPHKGSRPALTALDRVRTSRPGLRIEAFGPPEAFEGVPAWLEPLVGPGPDELAALYNRSRVYLNPSLSEGFGLTSIEAMACGSTVVTVANGGSADFAVDGENALVVPPLDLDAMVEALGALLDDPTRCGRLAEAGRVAAQAYTWDRSAGLLERFAADHLAGRLD